MIGIYTPYDASDTTTMALGLADLAISLGHSVSLFAFQTKQSGIHPEWDHKVKHDGNTLFTEWTKRCDHIVWFAFHPYRLNIAFKAKTTNTLVVLYSQLSADYEVAAQAFDNVIVPSQYIHDQLKIHWKGSSQVLPWDPGGPIVTKNNLVEQDKINVYIPVQGSVSEQYGPRLLYALNVVMSDLPKLHITLARQRRWTPASMRAIGELERDFPGRVKSIKVPTQTLRSLTYREHDWTFYPAYCDDVHLPVIHSLYSGTPTVVFDSAVAPEVITENSGHTISVRHPAVSALVSDPLANEIIKGLCDSICDQAYFQKLVSSPWPFLESRRRTFQNTWKRIWRTPMSDVGV